MRWKSGTPGLKRPLILRGAANANQDDEDELPWQAGVENVGRHGGLWVNDSKGFRGVVPQTKKDPLQNGPLQNGPLQNGTLVAR